MFTISQLDFHSLATTALGKWPSVWELVSCTVVSIPAHLRGLAYKSHEQLGRHVKVRHSRGDNFRTHVTLLCLQRKGKDLEAVAS